MKKLLLVAVFLLGFSMVVMAQDTPIAEVYGGYAYFHPDTQGGDSFNMNGFDLSAAINGNKWLGFLADFGGYYGSMGGSGDDKANVNIYTLMFGPKIAIRKGKVTPFGEALFGYGRVKATTDVSNFLALRENNFAMAFGGGVDINLNSLIAIRPAQLDYVMIQMQGQSLNNFRYTAGIVFRLGKR